MKKLLSVFLVAVLLFGIPMSANANTLMDTKQIEAYIFDSFDGSLVEKLSSFEITETKLQFAYNNRNYSFALSPIQTNSLNKQHLNGAFYYTGMNGSLVCNVIQYNDAYCVKIVDSSKNVLARKNDVNNNFTLMIGNHLDVNTHALGEAIKSEINIHEISTRANQLHVYVSGTTIPFLISAGSAEGWCTATLRENNQYQISSLSYVVAYNWPSDGVSLWYNDIESAFHTPAWSTSALTHADGTWTISGATGSFMAECTISALVKGFPVMYSKYDVSTMDGTHT